MTPHIAPLATTPVEPALALRGLTKVFGSTRAVENLSLDIPHGSFYGIVGPNGAGKTTAITMATGLLRPDAGDAYVCGHNVWDAGHVLAAKASYGLLADGFPVFDRLTGAEYLDYLGRLRDMPSDTIAERSTGLLEALGLNDAANKMITDYSAGMTKKILLAGALLHRPQILILDEPLEAVDPVSGKIIRQILTQFVHGGGTVVLSSHVMEVVEGLCDHVAVINQGHVVASGTLDEVRGGQNLTDVFVGLVGGGQLAEGALAWLDGGDL